MKRLFLVSILAVGLVAPGVAIAVKRGPHPASSQRCGTIRVGVLVKGTLTSYNTTTHEVTINITGGNSHGRALFDASSAPGFQSPAGTSDLTVDADNVRSVTFERRLGFEGSNAARPGDTVFAQGTVRYRKRGPRGNPCPNGGTYDRSSLTFRHLLVRAAS